MQSGRAVSYCARWPVWLCHIFPHYFTNGTFFSKKLLNIKHVFWFSLQLLSEKSVVLKRILSQIYIGLLVKYPLFLYDFNETCIWSTYLKKKTHIPSFIKIRPVGAEFFHAGPRRDRHEEARCHCLHFCKRTWKLLLPGQLEFKAHSPCSVHGY